MKPLLLISAGLCDYSLLVASTVHYFPTEVVSAEGQAPGLKAQLLSESQHLTAAHFTAIGAFSDATVAWYDVSRRTFRPTSVRSEVEVVSFIGNVTADEDNSPLVHIHCALGDPKGNLTGGHLLKAHVSVTLELFLNEEPASIHKVMDEQTGLKLIE